MRKSALLFTAAVVLAGPAAAQDVTVKVDTATGAAHVLDAVVPTSSIMSPQAKAVAGKILATEGPGGLPMPKADSMAEVRKLMNERLQGNVNHMREVYPVDIEETTIDGISVAIITPKGGVPAKNKNRVIINAPGGGFITGIRANGLLISIPVAAVGQFKVISLLYRQGPEHQFPAATEDFTKVYMNVIKTYKPANVGMVGCSAGGALIAQTIAQLSKSGIPGPGVAGIYCAGADAKFREGDSAQFAALATGNSISGLQMPYFAGMNLDDPAISPSEDMATLAKFPPTLFANGTRDFAMSRALYSHRRLLGAGVESQVLVYDGLGHGFMTNPDYPESKELYAAAAKFYDAHLGR